MKYKLVNNKISENYAQNLLKERGIEDYETFMNPTINEVQDPNMLTNINVGTELLFKHIKNKSEIIIIIDCDVDGYTSATILWNYLKEIDPNINLSYEIHSGKQHGLEDIMKRIEDRDNPPDLIILPDAGSNDSEDHATLSKNGINVLVLDHHEFTNTTFNNTNHACIINNQSSPEYVNKALTGAGIVWQFCRYFDTKYNYNFANKYIDLAAFGIISDMADVLSLENRYIIKNGLENINNYFFKVMIDKQSFSLGDKLSPMGVAFYITPLINAIIRTGTLEEKEKLFLAFIDGHQIVPSTKRGEKGLTEELAIQIARLGTNARNAQNKIKKEIIERLKDKILKFDLLSNKILFIKLEEEDSFPSVLNGIVAMQLAAEYKKPTIVARINEEGYIKGSGRGLNESELKDFKQFLQGSSLFEYCEGHPNAFGCSIKETNLDSLFNYSNIELKDINFNEEFFDVNFIFNANEDFLNLIYEIDKIKETFGQKNPEPLIVVENIIVTKKEYNYNGRESKYNKNCL